MQRLLCCARLLATSCFADSEGVLAGCSLEVAVKTLVDCQDAEQQMQLAREVAFLHSCR